MRRPPVSEEIANKIWSVLIEHCGVRRPEPGSTEARYDSYSFVHDAMEGSWVEYRFGGAIGFGGKVWHNAGKFYVSCYREEETPAVNAMIEAANKALAEIYTEAFPK